MEIKPKLLILADDDMVGAAKKGYISEFADKVRAGNIGFVTEKEAINMRNDGELTGFDNPKGEIFILNPYKQQYVQLNNNDIEAIFIDAKAVAYKRALLNMGAHCVILSEDVRDIDEKKVQGKAGGRYYDKSGEIDTSYEKKNSVNLSSTMRELDLDNNAKSIDEVRGYLLGTGLINDSIIKDYFDELCRKGSLNSTVSININFVSELQTALDVALNVDFSPISGVDLNLSCKTKHIHEITKSIKIYFGEVPDDVQKIFHNT